jgi:hypothetical protein
MMKNNDIELLLDRLDRLDTFPERQTKNKKNIIGSNNTKLSINNCNSSKLDSYNEHKENFPNSQYLPGYLSNVSNDSTRTNFVEVNKE